MTSNQSSIAYPADSAVYRKWSEIHRDHKTATDGVRLVMVFVPGKGTCLVPWVGPKGLTEH